LLVIVTANKLRNSVPVLFVTMMAGLMPDNRGAPLIAITLINFASVQCGLDACHTSGYKLLSGS